MVPWAYVMDDLHQMIAKTQSDGGLGEPTSMYELSAMADYNLARSRNMFGSMKNAFSLQSMNRRVPMHMMPDYMTWLQHTQPLVYLHLYGPGKYVPQTIMDSKPVVRQARDTRSRTARREPVKMPPVDEQGRIRHHHTYEEPPERSYRVQAGGLAERRKHQIRPVRKPTTERTTEAREIARKAYEAAQKRRQPRT